jgi:tetratricopeptide (TPR) repeat protein
LFDQQRLRAKLRGVAADDVRERSALIHREFLQVGVLLIVAVSAFFVTRAVAASNHDMSVRDAAEWYRRGQEQIDARKLDDAVDSFRRATVRDRGEKRYILALARALTLNQDYDAARGALLTLRESAPEDPDINLQLARLAAEREDVTEALRYYRNALYAPWPTEQIDARRQVRFELVRYLLAHNQTSRAQAELLALATDLPDDAALRLEAAQLFASATDNGHALDQFQRALSLAPENQDALTGAGQAAFRLGNYALAQTYLRRAPANTDDARRTREIVDLIMSNDPLASRLGSAGRLTRLAADLTYAQERLNSCAVERVGGQPTDEEQTLRREAQAFADQVHRPKSVDQDTVEAGMDVITRIERYVTQRCGTPTTFDQALVLIGRQHGADAR